MRDSVSLVSLALVAAVALETHTSVHTTKKNYDVILVGGGSAGCVVANRLTENPNVNVLLLEAGPASHVCTGGKAVILKCYSGDDCLDGHGTEYTPFDVPLWAQQCLNKFTWGERHTDDVAKCLGGSGTMNGMSFYRGHPNDFNSLRPNFGINGWDWPTVKEYYKKSEGYRGFFEWDTDTHNMNGPLRITDFPPDASVRFLQDSAAAAGFRTGVDLNNENRLGFGFRSANMKNGRRDTTASAFLCPAMSRPNLEVRVDAEVSNLILENQAGELSAVGVRYFEGGPGSTTVDVYAPTVILSGGTFGTPYILMRSGIGPRSELEQLGINVVLDLPGVGKNFRDDLHVQVQYEFIDSADPARVGSQSSEDSIEWLEHGTGPWTFGTLENGFILGENSSNPNDTPTIMFRRRPQTGNILLTLTPPPAGGPPTEVRLNPDLFSTTKYITGPTPERDIEEMAFGIETLRRIQINPPMSTYQREISPGPNVRTRDQLKDWIRARIAGFHHSHGTARMGLRSDPLAVVDEKLKVHGVKEGTLWVIDNAIFPRRVQSDSFAAAVLAGERGVEFVKEFFR